MNRVCIRHRERRQFCGSTEGLVGAMSDKHLKQSYRGNDSGIARGLSVKSLAREARMSGLPCIRVRPFWNRTLSNTYPVAVYKAGAMIRRTTCRSRGASALDTDRKLLQSRF